MIHDIPGYYWDYKSVRVYLGEFEAAVVRGSITYYRKRSKLRPFK